MSSYNQRLRAELVGAARRQQRPWWRVALPQPRLGPVLAGGAVACLLALVILAGRDGPNDEIDRAARPGPPPVALQGSHVRGDLALIIDPDRYTLVLPSGEAGGSVAVAGDTLILGSGPNRECAGSGEALYRFRVFDGALALRLINDGCVKRAAALRGTWRRGG